MYAGKKAYRLSTEFQYLDIYATKPFGQTASQILQVLNSLGQIKDNVWAQFDFLETVWIWMLKTSGLVNYGC